MAKTYRDLKRDYSLSVTVTRNAVGQVTGVGMGGVADMPLDALAFLHKIIGREIAVPMEDHPEPPSLKD